MAEPIHVHFSKIQEAIDSENWENVISIADKILKTTPEDKDALACKIAALIKNDQCGEALREIKSANDTKNSFLFEHAYALYKEKNVKAIQLLEEADVDEQKYYVLKAQTYYILEKFIESSKVYEEMEGPFGFHTDLLCNLVATYVRLDDLANANRIFEKYNGIIKGSFEGMYNIGTAFLEGGDLAKAREYLELSKSICESSLRDNGFEQDVIEGEVGIIRAQLAYIEQRKGESARALQMFQEIFESKAGLAVKAVCSNNIVTLREGDKFDSLRKLQKLKNDAVQSRLAPMQLQIIGFNHCLLLLSMNKADECRTLLESLQSQYPKNGLYPILASAMLQKEKKIPESQAILNTFIENNPESTANSSLVLAQMNLNQGELMKAFKILSGIEKFKNKPAMICTLVSLLKQLGDIEGAIALLDETVRSMTEKDTYYIPILRGNADFKFENGRFAEAAIVYKKLLSLDKGNQEITILLAMSYSYCDVEKAKETEKLLAPLPGTLEINAEELENLPMIVPTYVSSKVDKDALVEKEVEKKLKKKKKKKNKPPKNLNPMATPDPDRWKPKHMRHGYRGKKRGKVPNSRGVQGSASVSQAQQLSDTGAKTTHLKNTQQAQPQQQPIDKNQPTEAQRKAAAAAQAATSSKGGGGARGGKGGNKGGARKK
jgi:signal recognition particle subunit SRP72